MTRSLHKRYLREFLPAMGAYMLVMLLIWPLVPQVHSLLLKAALALLPMLPTLLAVRAMVRMVMGGDELEQRLHLIGLAVATITVGMLSLAFGFLAAGGLLSLDGSVLVWVFPLLIVVHNGARWWAARRYGGFDACQDSGLDRYAPAYLRLLLVAFVLAAIALLERRSLSDYRVWLLLGFSAVFAVAGMVSAVRRRMRHRRHGSEGG